MAENDEVWGPLAPYLASPEVTEIMVNGPQRIFVERQGRILPVERRFANEGELLRLVRHVLTASGKTLSPQVPLLDTRLLDGSRLTLTLPPVTATVCLTIRRTRARHWSLNDLVQQGALNKEAAEYLKEAVRSSQNILVTGGTSSGKTTLLNALAAEIPADARIVTLEDTFEIKLAHANWVALETISQGRAENAVDMRALVAHALHLRPDRILLGECRGGEALDFLQAMNSGHDGCMATLHANSALDAMSRLETLMLMAGIDMPLAAVRKQVARAIQLVVHTRRDPQGRREVTAISRVQSVDTGQVADQFALREIYAIASEPPVARSGMQASGRGPNKPA